MRFQLALTQINLFYKENGGPVFVNAWLLLLKQHYEQRFTKGA